ncbi:hypothetical protein JCM10212_005980 [Sporobolomyces blumeae]
MLRLSIARARQALVAPRSNLSRPFATSTSWSASLSSRPRPPIFQATATDVYPFGVPSDDPSHALFEKLSFTISNTDCWAVLSPSSSSRTRADFLSTLLHQVRYSPTQSAGHPILATLPQVDRPADEGGPRDRTVDDLIKVVSFKTRLGRSGEFDDYTARYYSIRDEDKLTTLDHLKQATGVSDEAEIRATADSLRMENLLDLPVITLSNGQTRRARILRALLAKPELLILEEPFTGLDVFSRTLLVSLLSELHAARSPRILLVLRPQDALPSFVSHVVLASNKALDAKGPNQISFGKKEDVLSSDEARELLAQGETERQALVERRAKRRQHSVDRQIAAGRNGEGQASRRTLIDLNSVSIVYGREGESGLRPVLRDVTWSVKEGERWVLAGHNGSGKSTLLAVILGDHPRSFTEDVHLFDKPRYRQATATIQQNIGHVSPEIFNAFPRKYGDEGLTAYEAIVTGFESVFSYRKANASQREAIAALLKRFNHPLLTPTFLTRLFAELTPGEQSLILLLRALVKSPPLLVLDEPFSGMDKETIDLVKRYLDRELDKDQSVILISHFEEEIPDSIDRRIELEEGRVKEII